MTKKNAVLLALVLVAGCGTAPETAREPIAPPTDPPPSPQPVTPPPQPPRPATTVECTAEEETIFSCAMPGGKRLAVCAVKGGAAEYRFGGDTPELTLTGGTWSNVPYSGGGEAQILFSNGDTDYLVFSRVVRTNFTPGEPNDPAFSDGVVILRGGARVATRLCAGGQAEASVDLAAAERALGKKEHVFLDD